PCGIRPGPARWALLLPPCLSPLFYWRAAIRRPPALAWIIPQLSDGSSRRTIAAAGPPQRAAECAPPLHLTTRQPLVYTPTRWRGCSCENVGSLPRTGSLRSSYGSCRDGWPAAGIGLNTAWRLS